MELSQAVFERINEYIDSLGLDFEKLPDRSYPKEFVRLLAGKVNAKNMGDAEAQAMALSALAQPFHDADLREEAKFPLLGLLNNDYFAKLPKGSMKRGSLDLLMIMASCEYPGEIDLMRIAFSAYLRLTTDIVSVEEVWKSANLALQDPEAVIADFEGLLDKECEIHRWTRAVLIEKCLEEFTREFMPAPELPEVVLSEVSEEELESDDAADEPPHTATFFNRHPDLRMALAVTGLVIGLAAIALATLATCGVAGLLGASIAAIAGSLTLSASLTTVSAVASGIGLFGGLSVAGGAYLVHTRPRYP